MMCEWLDTSFIYRGLVIIGVMVKILSFSYGVFLDCGRIICRWAGIKPKGLKLNSSDY